MASRPPLPHEQIVAYLRDESDKGPYAQILERRQEDPTYQALFDLIDEFKAQANLYDKINARNIPATFAAVEELLMRLYSGENKSEAAQQLISGLLQSPVFYQRLMVKLAAIAPQTAPEKTPELEHVRIKSDAQILAQVRAIAKPLPSLSEKIPVFISAVTAKVESTFDFLTRVPSYAYVVPLVLIGMAAIYQIAHKEDLGSSYVYDERVPSPPASGLRAPSDYSGADSLFHSFMSHFRLALSDYMRRDYQNTITALENLAPWAQSLQAGPGNTKFLPSLREYYFYLGVSYFALTRSQRTALGPETKVQHTEEAIRFLARADSLALAQQLSGIDRETFFLGLAYGFSGRYAEAVDQLNKIPVNSIYYNDVPKLVREWSNP
jgi:hypothetical protein